MPVGLAVPAGKAIGGLANGNQIDPSLPLVAQGIALLDSQRGKYQDRITRLSDRIVVVRMPLMQQNQDPGMMNACGYHAFHYACVLRSSLETSAASGIKEVGKQMSKQTGELLSKDCIYRDVVRERRIMALDGIIEFIKTRLGAILAVMVQAAYENHEYEKIITNLIEVTNFINYCVQVPQLSNLTEIADQVNAILLSLGYGEENFVEPLVQAIESYNRVVNVDSQELDSSDLKKLNGGEYVHNVAVVERANSANLDMAVGVFSPNIS